MRKYRIGIAGCGGIAHRHVEGYRTVAGEMGEVVAAYDVNQKAMDDFCETYKVPRRFTNVKDLVGSGEVDVISLLTPPVVRGEVIFPAVEHGIHVLVEKPFAEKMSDACSFVEAAEQAGVVLAVNQQFRFMPDILRAKEIIDSGEIGEVRSIVHDQFQNRTRVGGWRKDEERLEISIFSIHLLDRIRWLAGCPPEVVAAVTRYWNADVQGETFTDLNIQFSGSIVGAMVSNWHSLTIPECRLRIDGTEGSLLSVKKSVVSDPCTLTVHRVGNEIEHQDWSCQNAFILAMGESMKRLLRAISEGTAPPHSGRDNLETMAIVDAAYLSASRGGMRVDISEVWET
jgi:predicted dehydrogenase